jgi:hypothetical protein
MEIERILRRAIEVYLLTLRNELDVTARNFNISQAELLPGNWTRV